MNKTKAILFDVDGTLLNTHEYIYQSFEYALAKLHKSLPRETIKTIMGKPLIECYQILTGLSDVSHLTVAHSEYQKKNAALVSPFPNTISTLESLKEKGLLIAAITTRARVSVEDTLEYTEIMHYLNYVVTIEDVVKPKPSPEGIHKALTYFEMKPEEAIMVGDSDVDVFAGKNAGVKTIGVTYGFNGEKMAETNPDNVIDDIKEVINLLHK